MKIRFVNGDPHELETEYSILARDMYRARSIYQAICFAAKNNKRVNGGRVDEALEKAVREAKEEYESKVEEYEAFAKKHLVCEVEPLQRKGDGDD